MIFDELRSQLFVVTKLSSMSHAVIHEKIIHESLHGNYEIKISCDWNYMARRRPRVLPRLSGIDLPGLIMRQATA